MRELRGCGLSVIDFDFGTGAVGTDGQATLFTLPLYAHLSDLGLATVLYTGGNTGLDLLFSQLGLPVPLMVGDIINAYGDFEVDVVLGALFIGGPADAISGRHERSLD